MKLIIAEKPSVAKSIASALGASSRADGFYEGNGLLVSWCVGHLVDFQAQSHLPKMILNGFCFMTVNVQMYYETEQNAV